MRIGTWNVRTLRGLGKGEQLPIEMERNGLLVLGVTEIHLPGTGIQTLHENKGYTMLFSGRVDGGMSEGVGLAISPEARTALRSWHPITSRLLTAEFLTHMGPLAMVVAYVPTENSASEDKHSFFADFEEVMRSTSGLVILMGDFNARIGRQLKGVVGPHGLASGDSDSGERLVGFASAHDLNITNTVLPHKGIHQATWYPPHPRVTPGMKDFILVKRRFNPSVLDTRVYRGADLDSDHRLVVCKVKLKWKKARRGMKRINVELLKKEEIREQYVMELAECHTQRNRPEDVEGKWKDFQGAVRTTAEQILKGRPKVNKVWLQQDTLELVDKKRLAFRQEDRLDRMRREEYNILAKEVKRAVRRDKRKWWDDWITDMEEDMKRHRQGIFFQKDEVAHEKQDETMYGHLGWE